MKMTHRRREGAVLAETAASLVILIPLAILLTFVIAETSYCYFAKGVLAQAARQAARDLAIAYGSDPLVATSRARQEVQSFDRIRLSRIVVSSEQFADPVFQTGTVPHTVTVTVRLNLPNLPLLPAPDPLGLGRNYQISADSTYRLE